MEYGEPSEEELKSYTDTAREFKFDLGWLSASKFQEVVYHAVPLTSGGKSDFYHDNIAELRKKSRKFRAVLLLSEQASKMDLRTSDPTHQDLVERLTNGPDGGQNELVLAQQGRPSLRLLPSKFLSRIWKLLPPMTLMQKSWLLVPAMALWVGQCMRCCFR